MSRIDPDHRAVLIVTLAVLAITAVASFMVSWSGLVAVGGWAGLPPWLRPAVPIGIDGPILVYTLAIAVQTARNTTTWLSWTALGSFTIVSVASNAAHGWDTGIGGWRGAVGAAVVALAPIAVLIATHTLVGLVIAKRTPVQDAPTHTDVITRTLIQLTPQPGTDPTALAARLSAAIRRPKAASIPRAPRRSVVASGRDDAELVAMKRSGLTVGQIAERTGVPRSTVGAVTRGVRPDGGAVVDFEPVVI